MGLDTTHGCYHGGYRSFNTHRERIAKAIGFHLRSMEGFGGSVSFDTMNHPIKPLLDHSDCDGELSVDDCKSIVKGIEMIAEHFEEKYEDTLQMLGQFREGCLLAIKNNEVVKFQ